MESDAPKSAQTLAGPEPPSPPMGKQWAVLLISIAFSFIIFVVLDSAYTAYKLRSSVPAHGQGVCFIHDPVRHHSLQPNCTCIRHWGKVSYPFATNNLGFRDQTVREVPLTSVQPRVVMLGDSVTEGMGAWQDTFVGKIAANFQQYDFLNGGVESYSPSNYLNVARQLLDRGVKFDEVIVFIDISDAQDEAAFYQDANPSGAVSGPDQIVHNDSWYASLRSFVAEHLLITNSIFDFVERALVKRGFYHLNVGHGQLFDLERSAWTYRAVSDNEPYEIGYAPLGLEAGIRKEQSKMTALWQELKSRNIPISVVVYPWPAQVAHDTVQSRQVQIWRDWCAGKCNRFISIFPTLFAVKKDCPPSEPGCWYMKEYIFGDEHFSPAGNTLVAATVGQSLKQNPPLKVEQR